MKKIVTDDLQVILKNAGIKESIEDFDDEEMDTPEKDADLDDVPNLLTQLRKAVDVNGNYPIKFQNGDKEKLSMEEISAFVQKHMSAKPQDKMKLQDLASQSKRDFLKACDMNVSADPNKSIY